MVEFLPISKYIFNMTHVINNREGIVEHTDDTFDEIGEIRKNLLGDFDTAETVRKVLKGCSKTDDSREPIKVYLRVRPLTDKEIAGGESQDCLEIENSKTVALHPPKTSLTFKNQSRNTITGETFQRFTFSRVFGPETNQRKFFEDTSLDVVKNFINGQNSLVFSYGITNAGKSYTILGNAENLGVLPRTLKILFNSFKDQNYERTNIKPRMFCDCVKLNRNQEEREETKKKSLLALNDLPTYHQSSSESSDLFLQDTVTADQDNQEDSNLSSLLDVTSVAVDDQGPIQFCLWISFAEIYNENIYDLFEPISVNKEKKRATLKIGEDKKRNPYIKGLTEIHINNADEALKFLNIGRKHQKIASTKLNENSSRSHCIFTLKILRVVDTKEPHVARISRLSFVDLAGSERYTKTQNTGVRLKEAGNINTSLMTLGKCVELLRYNQNHVNNQKNIPFRESKLTRLFQGFFCGKGKASMIVNVNQCASAFDETLHALKFSAIAKKVTTVVQAIQSKPRISKFEEHAAARSTRDSVAWAEDAVLPRDGDEAELISDEMDAEEEEEDKSIAVPPFAGNVDYPQIIATLQQQLVEAKKQNILIEVKIRQEVSQEMAEQLVEIERNYNDRMVEEQRVTEELYEKRLDILSKSVKKARKRPRTERVEDDDDEWVSSVLLHQERVKNKEMSERIAELEEELEAVEKERAKNFENAKFSGMKDQVVSVDHETQVETENKELEMEMERLKNEIQLKDEKIKSAVVNLFELKAKAADLTVALEKQNNVMLDNGKIIDDLKRELASRDEHINILKEKNEDNEAKEAKTASVVEQRIAELGQAMSKLKNDNRKNIDDLEKKVVERDERVLELEKELTESLRQKDDERAEESMKENEKIAAFQDEIDRLQKQSEKEIHELNEIIAHRDGKIVSLEKTISKNEGLINAATEEMEKKNLDITALGKEVRKLEASKIEECESLRKQLRCRDEQVEQLDRTLKDYKVELESKTTQLLTVKKVQGGRSLTPIKAGQNSLAKQLEKSTAALDKKNSQLITRNNQVTKLENSLEELRGDLSEKNEELNGLRVKFEQLKEGQKDSNDVTINNLRTQLKEQEGILLSKSKEKEEAEENLKFVEGELQILSNKENESQEELRKLKEERDETKQEAERLKLEVEKHKEVEGNLSKQLEAQAGLVARQVEELKRIIEKKQEDLLQFKDRHNKEVADLNDANQALQQNFDKALQDLANVQATVAERNKKLDDLENVDATLKDSYRCKEAEITDLKKELELAREKLETKDKIESQKIKEEILKVNKNWENTTERMKTGLEEQDEVLARMETELAKKDEECVELGSQMEKLLLESKKVENLTRENEKLDEQCELYKIKIFELETEVEKLQQEVRREASKKDSATQALRDGLEIVKVKKLDYETKMNEIEEVKKCLEMKAADLEREVERLKFVSSETDEKTDSTEAESGNSSSGDVHYVYKPVEVESFNSSVKDRVEIDVTPITGRGLPKSRKKNASGKSKSLKRKSSDLTLKEIQEKIHSKSAKKENCSEDEFTPVSVTKLRKTRNSSSSGRSLRRGTNITSSISTCSLSTLEEDSENTNPLTQSSQKSSAKRKLLNKLQLPEGLKSKTEINTDTKSKKRRKLFKKTEISAPLTDSPFAQSDKCESPAVSKARDVIMRRLRSRDLKVTR